LEWLDKSALWQLCRTIADAIGDKKYRVGPDIIVPIPKDGQPGQFRKISIQDIQDRIVGKAVQLVLQPVVDRGFSPFSFGYRPNRGRLCALGTALALARRENRWFWVSADVKNAFDAVPFRRFMDACVALLGQQDDLLDFIRLIASTGKRRGIRQGSPASPLFYNIFSDYQMDRPWHRDCSDQPLLRYADDLLLLCRTRAEAVAANAALCQLARSAGTPLKTEGPENIRDLAGGQELEWMGFLIQGAGDEMAIRIGPKAFDRLEAQLAKAHLKGRSPLRAIEIINGWIRAMGPCFQCEDRQAVLERVSTIAGEMAFDEIPSATELEQRWSAGHAAWHKRMQIEGQYLASRLSTIRSRVHEQ
jgi:hypothetical protein